VGPAVIVTAPAAEAYTPSQAAVTLYRYRVVNGINAQRARHGLGKVWLAACPQRYAQTWSAFLARTQYFYHRDMMTYLKGCNAQRVAENLGRGNVSADRMVAAWMASPGHRKNILNGKLNMIGVGVVYSHGSWTVTTDFSGRA